MVTGDWLQIYKKELLLTGFEDIAFSKIEQYLTTGWQERNSIIRWGKEQPYTEHFSRIIQKYFWCLAMLLSSADSIIPKNFCHGCSSHAGGTTSTPSLFCIIKLISGNSVLCVNFFSLNKMFHFPFFCRYSSQKKSRMLYFSIWTYTVVVSTPYQLVQFVLSYLSPHNMWIVNYQTSEF